MKKKKKFYKVITCSTKDGFDPEYNSYSLMAFSPEHAIKKINNKIDFEEGEEINAVEFLGIPFEELIEKDD